MRVLAWFSCGVASACAAYFAIEKYGKEAVCVVNCDTLKSEHPDNRRFLRAVEGWLGVEVHQIRSGYFADVDKVFEETKYMAGIHGARCTTEMKKLPR